MLVNKKSSFIVFAVLTLCLFLSISSAIAYDFVGYATNNTNPSVWQSFTMDVTSFVSGAQNAYITFDLRNDAPYPPYYPDSTKCSVSFGMKEDKHVVHFAYSSGMDSSHWRNVRLYIDGEEFLDQYESSLGDENTGTSYQGAYPARNILGEIGPEASNYYFDAKCEIKVTKLYAEEDIDIQNISDPIWDEDNPTGKPIADGNNGGFSIFTKPGMFKVKAILEAAPGKPSWDPKVEYRWNISGGLKQGTGILELKDLSDDEWYGEFEIQMPNRVGVGKYQINFVFEIFDENGKQIGDTETMSHTLYATYKESVNNNPKEKWLQKATSWASGAEDPFRVARLLTMGIYNNSSWLYRPYEVSWFVLVEGGFNLGDCVSFSNVWLNLGKVLGIKTKVKRTKGWKWGFVTRKNCTSLDQLTGNASLINSSIRDRWFFPEHQVGAYGGFYFDPTFGKVYGRITDFIEWRRKRPNMIWNMDENGVFYPLEKGHKLYWRPDWEFFGWNDWEYHSPAHILKLEPNKGAIFSGQYSIKTIDNDGDNIYNNIVIDLEIKILNAGKYSILVLLSNSNGDLITMRSNKNSSTLESYSLSTELSGVENISLTLSGEEIYISKKDGVYTFELILMDENGLVIDQASFNTISSYSHTQFGELPARMKVLNNYGEDANADGLYDNLVVELDVDVFQPLNYRFEGVLYSQDNEMITSVNILKYLDHSQTVQLNFDGLQIYKSGLDGEYKMLIVLHDENEEQVEYIEQDTAYYQCTDFQTPINKFTGNYTDSGNDTDSDGLYNYLVIETELEIVDAGDYGVEGWLYDSEDNQIDVSLVSETLNQGENTVDLSFNGISIKQNQINGPYVLKYLTLKDDEKVCDFIEEAYTTSEYAYTEFENSPSPLVSLTGNYSDYTIDTDGDNISDYLIVNAEIISQQAGNVYIEAHLKDTEGNQITWAMKELYVNADENTQVQLQFEGEKIYEHRVDGPYYLTNVYIYLLDEPIKAYYSKNSVYETRGYQYTEFGASAITAIIEINPKTLNLKSKGKYITCYIELPEEYDVETIDVNTITLSNSQGEVSAEAKPTEIGDYDSDGNSDLMVKFSCSEIISLLSEQTGNMTFEIKGELDSGERFIGEDSIKVK